MGCTHAPPTHFFSFHGYRNCKNKHKLVVWVITLGRACPQSTIADLVLECADRHLFPVAPFGFGAPATTAVVAVLAVIAKHIREFHIAYKKQLHY